MQITAQFEEEIAPMFKGISHNVIFPVSFRPFVEQTLPKLRQAFLKAVLQDHVIFPNEPLDQVIEQLPLAENEKSLAQIILNTPMYPTDSNGRDRIFEIEDILSSNPNEIWKKTKKYSGITEDFFYEYFENREIAHAIKIKGIKKYEKPLSLKDDFKVMPPQSYLYL